MSATRLARSAFQSAARRAAVAPRASGRRGMASAAEGASHHAPKSDTPWIVGSALVFGPALAYLLSPSGRKNTPAVHDDKHDYPTLKTHEHPPSFTEPKNKTVMKDDEGTEADVTASIALAEEANAPKNDVSDDKWAATKAAAEEEGTQAAPVTPATGSEAAATGSDSIGKKDRSGDFQAPYTEGPVDNKPAQKGAHEDVQPLKQRKKEEEAKERGEFKKD